MNRDPQSDGPIEPLAPPSVQPPPLPPEPAKHTTPPPAVELPLAEPPGVQPRGGVRRPVRPTAAAGQDPLRDRTGRGSRWAGLDPGLFVLVAGGSAALVLLLLSSMLVGYSYVMQQSIVG